MSKQGCRLWVVCLMLLAWATPLQAEFTLDLSLNGPGSVLVVSGSGTNTYTTNSIIPITSASATLVAQPKSLKIDGVPSAITLPFGNDIELDLTTTLGSKFLEWTGSAIQPGDPQNPSSQNYVISGSGGVTKSITANFSTDIGDVNIFSIEFGFMGQSVWIPATSWNYTGDDGPIPSLTGNTLITLAWSDFVSLIDLNNTNRVDMLIIDNAGNTVLDSFDLDVSPTAVPEPSSLVLVAVAVGGLLGRAARVRRKEKGERRKERGVRSEERGVRRARCASEAICVE